MTPVSNPFPLFTDTRSQIAEGAQIYIGLPNQDPETAPAAVFWDAALTIPAAQPLRTVAGYIVNGGTPATPYVTGAYSIRVRQANGTIVYYNPSVVDGITQVTQKLDELSADFAAPDGADRIGFLMTPNGAQKRTAQDKLREAPRSPEDYAGGIQAAINDASSVGAAAGAKANVPVQLKPAGTYTITTGLTMSTERVSLLGGVTIQADIPNGATALVIDSAADSPLGNAFGFKGRIEGNVRLFGKGIDAGQRGVFLNGTNNDGSAQIGTQGLTIARFKTGIEFGNHGYNSTFYRSEILECETCVSVPAGNIDNGERNDFVSCTLANSLNAIVVNEQSAKISVIGGSIDYTTVVARVSGGKVSLTDTHIESRHWNGFAFDAQGDGGLIDVKGGLILHNSAVAGSTTPQRIASPYLAYVGAGARLNIEGTFIHNLLLTRQSPDIPTAFINGPGMVRIRNTHGYDGGELPDRLSAMSTSLNDASYEADDWRDMIWIAEDTAAITSRRSGTNVTIGRSPNGIRSGTKALSIAKVNGTSTPATVGFIYLPVELGGKAMAGTHFRAALGSPDIPFSIMWRWASLDRFDANGLPIWLRSEDAYGGYNNGLGEPFTASQTWQMAVFGKEPGSHANRVGLFARQRPPWATHFVAFVRLFGAPISTLLLDDSWQDAW